MQAYLQTQECWDVVSQDYHMPIGPQGTPAQPARGTTAAVAAVPSTQEELDLYNEELPKWRKANNYVQGCLTLRIHHNLRHHCNTIAARMWHNFATEYGSASPSAIFADFKMALLIKLHGGNLIPEIEKLATIFGRLATNHLPIAPQMQVIMLLATLPAKWDSVVHIFMQRPDLNNQLTFTNIHEVVGQVFERHG